MTVYACTCIHGVGVVCCSIRGLPLIPSIYLLPREDTLYISPSYHGKEAQPPPTDSKEGNTSSPLKYGPTNSSSSITRTTRKMPRGYIAQFRCYDCDRNFNSEYSLIQHLNSSIHDPVYECDECDREFVNQHALDQHLNSSIHDPTYTCDECDRDFVSEEALDQHLTYASIHRPKYCAPCNKFFGTQEALNRHLDSPIHNPVYLCDDCDREFVNQQALDQHLNSSIHAPVYLCDDCDRYFVNQLALDQHLNSSIHDPVYECDECDREFVNQEALDQHLNSTIHRSVYIPTQFHCCECDRDFSSDTALEQHLRDKIHTAQISARAEFYCKKCDREFGDEDALRKHLASVIHHPLVRDLMCCGKSFTSPSAMLHHLESGACSKGMTRGKIDQLISYTDTHNIITSGTPGPRPRSSILPSSGYGSWPPSSSSSSSSDDVIYTPQSSTNRNSISSLTRSMFSSSGALTPDASIANGMISLGPSTGSRSCPLCPNSTRKFQTSEALWAHMCSPAHSPKIYHCPLPLVPEDMRAEGKMKNFSTLSGLTQHLESGVCSGGKQTFRKAVALVNEKLRDLGLADMRLIA